MTDSEMSWMEAEMKQPPKACVTRVGRWLYDIEITHGAMGVYSSAFPTFGARRARRKAERLIRRYVRKQEWRKQSYEFEAIRWGDLTGWPTAEIDQRRGGE